MGFNHLAAECGEFAEGDDQVIKHITESIMG